MDEIGYLIPQGRLPRDERTSEYSMMSNVTGIFLAGDIEDKFYRQAITAAGDGCKAAIECEKWLESLDD
jgi:thioredoxin reductase (NADPH)